MSSSYDSDGNDYGWDDITPSLQDQIFDELDSQTDLYTKEEEEEVTTNRLFLERE